jgi:ribosomal protein S18 acetylase RimI-like enzyme
VDAGDTGRRLPAEVVLRRVVAADGAFLRQVFASTRTAELALVDWDETVKDAFIEMQFTTQQRHYTRAYPDASFQVIVVDGEAAGRLSVARSPKEIHVIDIALLPAFRGRGVGTALMENVLAEASASGAAVTAHVLRDNPARRWYLRLGFAFVEDRDPYLFLRHP